MADNRRIYEGMFLLDTIGTGKPWQELQDRVYQVLAKHGAKVLAGDRWAERKLTYEIKKRKRATYLLAYFEASPGSIREIERELSLSDALLRQQILANDTWKEGQGITPLPEEDTERRPEPSWQTSTKSF